MGPLTALAVGRAPVLGAVLMVTGCAATFGHPAPFSTGALGGGWQALQSKAARAYFRQESSAVIMANGDCLERDAPLAVLSNSLLIGTTDRHIEEERRLPLAGREALYRRLRVKLDGVPLAVESYVVKKDGCVYDLAYLAPLERAGEGRADFQRFVAGFRVGSAERAAAAQARPADIEAHR
jgi:hypothetical protein